MPRRLDEVDPPDEDDFLDPAEFPHLHTSDRQDPPPRSGTVIVPAGTLFDRNPRS